MITSVTDLLIMGPDGLPATGWNLKEVEQRALGFLCHWWGGNAASDKGGDLDLFSNLTRDDFRSHVIKAHMESARSQIKEGIVAMTATHESPAVATVGAPAGPDSARVTGFRVWASPRGNKCSKNMGRGMLLDCDLFATKKSELTVIVS